MSPASEFPPEPLREAVLRHLPAGTDLEGLDRITTGKFNTSYAAATTAGEFVLRIAPPPDSVFLFYERDMMRQEPGLHRLLRERTDVPVAEILAFDGSGDVLPRDYLLMERLPGRALSETHGVDTARVLGQVGECLAQVHCLTAERYGYLGEHRPMDPQPTWAEAFRVMWGNLLADIAGVGFYGPDETRALEELLERHLALFDRPVPASLLHMDVWSQNLLVDRRGNLTGIVDWDRALWGDPEIEFAVLDYCGVSEPAFWEGYGRARDTSREAEVRRIFYLLYEVQKYIVIRAGRSGDRRAAEAYTHQSLDLVRRAFGDVLP